ncbi:phosphonate ABC transporter substrate-binding protein [Paracraurococcus ruber]|uniref:Phosphonate ABC transporter substrate-binding protein n=1 Tax=Paracraurococcus ruber TaxID=77675 RepID=A0ABS1D3W8_9PROT|nr:phosphonate ABC transporter substrate-binding protein [Paracraurococcus ruber]MBK1661188.1 phosphonate ABC transporter substrate-binding protein [Paracraurococcus ruber]TDG27472.1 phosphonate ABC transporter substrate-binding protein [Paracraurococcus ruber]
MFRRRHLLGAAAALAATPAPAQSWRGQFPELVFAVIPAENAQGVINRYTPFTEHLARVLGTKVTLRVANDYAAVVEGQRAGNIHIAAYGPSAFARALMTGAQIEAFAIEVNQDGSKGYYSVFYVRKDSPFQKIEDLRGKNLGLVDPNSTSGNNVPRFAMNRMGINPEQFFGRVVYTGSHENAVIALQQGTVDVAANWWNDEQESNLLRMARKNMVKAEDFRIIFRSDQIVNSPMAYLATLPAELKSAIRAAVLDLPQRDPALFERLTDGKQRPWEPTDNAAYQPIIELNRFVDGLRRQRS